MNISLNSQGIKNWNGETLVLGLVENSIDDQISQLTTINLKSLGDKLDKRKFKGKPGQITSFDFLEEPSKIIFVGLGKLEEITLQDLRFAAASAAKATIGSSGKMGLYFPWDAFDFQTAAKAIGESVRLTWFKDSRFKSQQEIQIYPEEIQIICESSSDQSFLNEIDPICAGVELARELVGAPPNSLTPKALAEIAIEISKQFNLDFKILDKKECEKRNMGAFLSVAKGSDLDPQFIHLIYRPNGQVKRRLALVGKGLTFDSGGYNLKVGASQIEMMKFDMGGSASVLGTARSIAELRPEGIEIHFIVASCENMINGEAVHPGDIVKASNGTTIEINNTDAEGRLTLADALVYACQMNPDEIVDLATLTGACVIALGDEIAGLWSNSDHLAEKLIKASTNSGEGLWRMPLKSSYKEGLKSSLADMRNTGPRGGGSITAALFLKEFVNKSINWAHIDMAGTVWSEKGRGLSPAGATGYGVRTLINWICESARQI
tara:strand:+ start:3030 stop:4508 length:1479 start_codon:yes stop_codon:yes gene_type:complete